MPITKALRDVELVTVGKHGGSVIGPDGVARAATTEVTRADLEAMLAAADELAADAAPVKLGHDSALNAELGDGAPAFGWVRPTRIARNAAGLDTLYGDLVGMPAKLAEVAPAAFRRRSVEIGWDATVGGKAYRAVLTAVALLGIAAPAVKTLADVLALYTAPDVHEQQRTALELGAPAELVTMLADARRLGLADAVIAPLEAEVAARDTATVPAPTDDDAETPSQTSPTPTPEDPAMPKASYTPEELRALLKIEADADVDAALAALVNPPAETPPAPAPGDATGGAGTAATSAPGSTTDAPPAAPAQTPELVGVGAGAGTVTLSAGVAAELQRDAAYARSLRRNALLDDAQRAGKITPAERGQFSAPAANGQPARVATGFAAAVERDEEGATALLSSMVPRFAVTELGAADATTAPADAAFDQFSADVFGITRS